MATRKTEGNDRPKKSRPATTPQGVENEMISLAVDFARKQFEEGTASSQLTVHYLKLATANTELERDKLRAEKALLEAKVEQMAYSSQNGELYAEAIKAMSTYQGRDDEYLYDE